MTKKEVAMAGIKIRENAVAEVSPKERNRFIEFQKYGYDRREKSGSIWQEEV